MRAEEFLKKATRTIYSSPMCGEVRGELQDHIEDLTEEFLSRGLSQEEAEERAVRQMGDPQEIGLQFYNVYRPGIEWKEVLWIFGWTALFGATKLSGLLAGGTDDGGFIRAIGMIFLIYGVIDSAVEKYMDLPFLYAWAKNWGSAGIGGLANAALFAAIGIGLWSESFLELLLLTLLITIIIQAERIGISRLRERKEQRYLWEIGTAEQDFDYQGRVKIGDEVKKVRIKRGQSVKEGEMIMIMGIDGFRLLCENL